jgi:two-component system OmpR family response regulator
VLSRLRARALRLPIVCLIDRAPGLDLDGQGTDGGHHVSALRRTVDKDRQLMIHTVRGVGYVLKPADR